jgi:hypothetical protein
MAACSLVLTGEFVEFGLRQLDLLADFELQSRQVAGRNF